MPRYYCTMRPPAPRAIPKGAAEIMDYGRRRYTADIDRLVWGWVDYERELTFDEVSDYGLIREPRADEWG